MLRSDNIIVMNSSMNGDHWCGNVSIYIKHVYEITFAILEGANWMFSHRIIPQSLLNLIIQLVHILS